MTDASPPPPYDRDARRETPLLEKLRQGPLAGGKPMPLSDFMAACLLDPDHSYYTGQPVFGTNGDFTTAPEITQIFGELLGIWCVVTWRQLGAPETLRIVELGPGRGTLMADLLRSFLNLTTKANSVIDLSVTLVEASAPLASEQAKALSRFDVPIVQVPRLADVEAGAPTIVIANEFFDALPITQFRARQGAGNGAGVETCHVIDTHEGLQFAWIADDAAAVRLPDANAGAIHEVREQTEVISDIARLGEAAPLLALIIDYGTGAPDAAVDTLQAVRNHAYEHPLTSPGEADLSTQVNFGAIANEGRSNDLVATEVITQGDFLTALGAHQRAGELIRQNLAMPASISPRLAG
ncbi:MAG: SAM-dependent methyltransferase, partial [Pseudomonadota bacterium]